ncbi:unnamed protein product [Pleuronectes platessa]|uniref:Uncharacterized protein n=1 Tax=Pleuronectes platessa TaxID=8262 RepID=A0A9N7VV69_PLEPL|nr:unnamed protein product [Pleuronectes platessa]
MWLDRHVTPTANLMVRWVNDSERKPNEDNGDGEEEKRGFGRTERSGEIKADEIEEKGRGNKRGTKNA